MQYQGGKARIAMQIAAKIRELHPTATEIWEPFCGGGAVTLAAPDPLKFGKIKLIEMQTDGGDVTLALTNVVGQSSGTTATFNDAGDQLVLQAGLTKWIVLKERGISLS